MLNHQYDELKVTQVGRMHQLFDISFLALPSNFPAADLNKIYICKLKFTKTFLVKKLVVWLQLNLPVKIDKLG